MRADTSSLFKTAKQLAKDSPEILFEENLQRFKIKPFIRVFSFKK